MIIEVLYFAGCPNHKSAVERVKQALRAERILADVVEIEVPDADAAQRLGFLGSPSIRVDGLDIEPGARMATAFGMMCRTYLDAGRRSGLPSQELIQAALQSATASASKSGSPPVRQGTLFIGGSLLAAIAASLCCILPVVAAVTGAGALAAGVAFERWRPYLLGLTGLLLAGGILIVWRDHKKACDGNGLCMTKPMRRWSGITLGMLAASVVAVAAFPHYSGTVARMAVAQTQPRVQPLGSGVLATVAFRIPDMDCPACAVVLSTAYRKLPGIVDAKLDVDSRNASITYDPTAQSITSLEGVVTKAGFHIASTSLPSGQTYRAPAHSTGDFVPTPLSLVDTNTVRQQFNRGSDKVRIVALLSPTCPGCQSGHGVVAQVLKKYSSSRLQAILVWEPMLSGDNPTSAAAQAGTVRDQRIVQGWNESRGIGDLFGETLKLHTTVWDVYLVYKPGVEWQTQQPPPPTFWMHQLQDADPKLLLCENPGLLIAEVGKLLDGSPEAR